jgi:hypothetical protein
MVRRTTRSPLIGGTVKPSLALASLLLVSSACVTLPQFQKGKAVEMEAAALGHSYKQGGKPIDLGSVMKALEADDATKAEAASAHRLMIGANTLGAVGGFGLGWGVASGLMGVKSGWGIAGGGLVVAGIGVAIGAAADKHLSAAVVTYNRRIGAGSGLLPWFAPTTDASGRASGVQGGLSLRF